MARYKPLIPKEKLDCSLFENSFGKYAHDVYMLYDSIADELIIKLERPTDPTSLYSIGEDTFFIVNLVNYKVIGISLTEFQVRHLPRTKDMLKLWYKEDLPNKLNRYVKFHYSPKKEPRDELYVSEVFTNTTMERCKEVVYA